jgi:hypothetical protein
MKSLSGFEALLAPHGMDYYREEFDIEMKERDTELKRIQTINNRNYERYLKSHEKPNNYKPFKLAHKIYVVYEILNQLFT